MARKRSNSGMFGFPLTQRKRSNLNQQLLTAGAIILVVYFFIQNPGFGLLLGAIVGVAYGVIWKLKHDKKKRMDAALLQFGQSNPMGLTPHQYEQFCGLLLQQNGWQVSYTKRTGDQGADIIGEKPNRRIIVQCKQWSSSVGNQAVQEVHAACSFYGSKHAPTQGIVVATSDYTSGAKDLARKTGVLLMSHLDLVDFQN